MADRELWEVEKCEHGKTDEHCSHNVGTATCCSPEVEGHCLGGVPRKLTINREAAYRTAERYAPLPEDARLFHALADEVIDAALGLGELKGNE